MFLEPKNQKPQPNRNQKPEKNRKWTFMSKHIGEQTNGLINCQQKVVLRFESAGQNLVGSHI